MLWNKFYDIVKYNILFIILGPPYIVPQPCLMVSITTILLPQISTPAFPYEYNVLSRWDRNRFRGKILLWTTSCTPRRLRNHLNTLFFYKFKWSIAYTTFLFCYIMRWLNSNNIVQTTGYTFFLSILHGVLSYHKWI